MPRAGRRSAFDAFASERAGEGGSADVRAGPSAAPSIRWYAVALPRVCVRRGPSLSHRIVGVRRRDDLCAAVERRGAWVRVLPRPSDPARPLWMLTTGSGYGLPDQVLTETTEPPAWVQAEEALGALAEEVLEPWSDEELPHLHCASVAGITQKTQRDALIDAYTEGVRAWFKQHGKGAMHAGASGAQQLILEYLSPRILRFGSPAVVAGGWGRGSKLNQLSQPRGICLGEGAQPGTWVLYVSDTGNHRIMMWPAGASKGSCVAGSQEATFGSGPQQLRGPQSCVLGTDGTLYVADTYNGRILAWPKGAGVGRTVVAVDMEGRRLRLEKPCALRTGEAGVLYVADFHTRAVHKYWLQQESEPGAEVYAKGMVLSDRSAGLLSPRGIHVVHSRRVRSAREQDVAHVRETIYVADGLRHEIICLEDGHVQQHARPALASEIPRKHPTSPVAGLHGHSTPANAIAHSAASAPTCRARKLSWKSLPSVGTWLNTCPPLPRINLAQITVDVRQVSKTTVETGDVLERSPSTVGIAHPCVDAIEPDTVVAPETWWTLASRLSWRLQAAIVALYPPSWLHRLCSWIHSTGNVRCWCATGSRYLQVLLQWLTKLTPLACVEGACSRAPVPRADLPSCLEAQSVGDVNQQSDTFAPPEKAKPSPSAMTLDPATDSVAPGKQVMPPEGNDRSTSFIPPTPNGQTLLDLGLAPSVERVQMAEVSGDSTDGALRDEIRGEGQISLAAETPSTPSARRVTPAMMQAETVVWQEEPPREPRGPQTGTEIVGGLFGRGQVNSRDLRLYPDGRLADSTGQVFVFGKFDAPDQLSEPKGLWYHAEHSALYVADSGNGRIQRFRSGNPLGETVAGGPGVKLEAPADVVLAADGALFVSDSASDRVLRFPPIWG